MSDAIAWFADIGLADRPAVGGKGGSLGELTKAGLAVPPGFVVRTEAFERFIVALDARQTLRAKIEALDPDDLPTAQVVTDSVRTRVEAEDLPGEVRDAIANLQALGHSVDVDPEAIAEITRYFDALAEAEDLPVGAPLAYDAAYQRHQLPGGMVGTMRRHLGEQRLGHLEGAVIEEIGRVREELGWPIVMTPFAQMVLTQAVMNVTGAERYATIPDEVMRYALGKFGRPNVPIAAEVMDRIMASPRAKDLAIEEGMPDVATLRKRVGERLSDEEFLLRATMPVDQVDAMREVAAAEQRYDPKTRGALRIVRDMLSREDIAQVSIERPGFRLELA